MSHRAAVGTALSAATLLAAIVLRPSPVYSHKPITTSVLFKNEIAQIFQRKCFQCHQASMWSSLRQDRKAWEGVLYRMVGRGALWTEDEIRAMADFLGQTRGPK